MFYSMGIGAIGGIYYNTHHIGSDGPLYDDANLQHKRPASRPSCTASCCACVMNCGTASNSN